MGFLNILLLIIKYGPAVFELIKKAIELIRWLRENNDEKLAEAEVSVNSMAARGKKAKNYSELKDYIADLERKKAEVEARNVSSV